MEPVHRFNLTVPAEVMDENRHVNNVAYMQWMQAAATRHSAICGGARLARSLGATITPVAAGNCPSSQWLPSLAAAIFPRLNTGPGDASSRRPPTRSTRMKTHPLPTMAVQVAAPGHILSRA